VLARDCFHIRKLAIYFAALLAWRIVTVTYDNPDLRTAIVPTLMACGLACLALGIVALLAWFSARTTIYTITDRRVVMRVGIVLSVTFNLPFKHIEAANLRPLHDGHGDIALTLDESTRIAYLHLWPHARPWKVARVQPSLRSIDHAADVAQRLTSAWKALRAQQPSIAMTAPIEPQAPRPQPRLVAVSATSTAIRTGRGLPAAEAA
jgi:uncharacterized membrane protein